jgi:hypothetical protein
MEEADDEGERAEHPIAVAVWQPAVGQTLESVLGTVAFKSRKKPEEVGAWVEAVSDKLQDIGIESLRDFVTDVLVVNQRLKIGGHKQLHNTTKKLIWAEICEILFGTDPE